MTTAAVAELKASLSEYLAGVKAGQEILVTERGLVIARIVPVHGTPEGDTSRIRHLERAGLARAGSGQLPATFWTDPLPEDPEGSVVRSLVMEREDGR